MRPWLLVLLASVPSGTRGMCTCQGDPTCWCWSNCTATLDAACGGGRPRDAARPGVDPADACRACAGSSQPTLAQAGCTAAKVEAFCAKKRRPVFQAFWNSPLPGCCIAPMVPVPAFERFNITLNTGPYYPRSTVCQGGVGTAEKPCFNGQEILTMYIEGTGCAPAFLPPVL